MQTFKSHFKLHNFYFNVLWKPGIISINCEVGNNAVDMQLSKDSRGRETRKTHKSAAKHARQRKKGVVAVAKTMMWNVIRAKLTQLLCRSQRTRIHFRCTAAKKRSLFACRKQIALILGSVSKLPPPGEIEVPIPDPNHRPLMPVLPG